jgi:hypothetical protein
MPGCTGSWRGLFSASNSSSGVDVVSITLKQAAIFCLTN